MSEKTGKDGFEGWGFVEVFSHHRVAGLIRIEERCGQSFLRIDVPSQDGPDFATTLWYAPHVVDAVTPTSEPVARELAMANKFVPVTGEQLPLPSRDE